MALIGYGKVALLRHRLSAPDPRTLVNLRQNSRGSLGGGFNKEGLRRWAASEWNGSSPLDYDDDDDDCAPYADLFKRSISKECAAWLDSHPSPSSELGRAFFGNPNFAMERTLLTPLFLGSAGAQPVPAKFDVGETYLLWTVAVRAPLELICTWSLGRNVRGCTMVAFDPSLRRIFLGSGVESSARRHAAFQAFLPIHERYSEHLLAGMVDHLENEATEHQ